MFIGAINSTIRKYLASVAPAFDGAVVVIGCSGNFTNEVILAHHASPQAVHSNDVSFYSCLAGRWLAGESLPFEVIDPEFDWLKPYLDTPTNRLAAVMVLLSMLDYYKRNNPHRVRMWNLYRSSFDDLAARTVEKLNQVTARVDSFFAGDVFGHFVRFETDPDAIFCCYPPTYTGGYERLYNRLDSIVRWDKPTYPILDEARRQELLAWMTARRFIWCDDRPLDGMKPVLEQRSNLRKTIYLYSNVLDRPAYFEQVYPPRQRPDLPLADSHLYLTSDSRIELIRITTTDLSYYKDLYLNKAVEYGPGSFAFAVMAGGLAVGFVEFSVERKKAGEIYLQADFAIPVPAYPRLSKLVVMLAKSGQTRRVLERLRQVRCTELLTTAYTDKPVSMKYRGVFKLTKRGQTGDGRKFLNYTARFDDLTWQETYQTWWTQHNSRPC